MSKTIKAYKNQKDVLRCCFVIMLSLAATPAPSFAQYGGQNNTRYNAPSHAQLSETRKAHLRKQIHGLHEARKRSPHGREPNILVQGHTIGNNPQLVTQLNLERNVAKEVSQEIGYDLDVEPNFIEIKFYEPVPPKTLSQRIDALLFGSTVIVPTEYDLYGYELRRYMQSVASPKTFGDRKILGTQLSNTKRAAIILEYWDKKIRTEIDDIAEIIDNDDSIDSTTRTTFRFNRGKASAFLLEADSWVSNNRKTLDFLFKRRGGYEYQHPSINFATREDADQFKRFFEARQKSVEIMQKYPAFRMMIF